jgi:hypothetical protein
MNTTLPVSGPAQPAAPSNGAALLRWRTHDTSRHLAQGLVGALAIALITGCALWTRIGNGNLVQLLLLVHLAAGLLAFLLFVPFIIIHWRDGREPLKHLLWPFPLLAEWQWDAYARKRLIGHAFLWLFVFVVATGLIVAAPAVGYLAGHPVTLPYGGHAPLLGLHRWLTLALFAAFIWHLPKKSRP